MEALLQGSVDDAYEDLNSDQENDRREVEGTATETDRGDDPTDGEDHRVDDAIEEYLDPAEWVRRGDPNPGKDHPGEDRVEVDR